MVRRRELSERLSDELRRRRSSWSIGDGRLRSGRSGGEELKVEMMVETDVEVGWSGSMVMEGREEESGSPRRDIVAILAERLGAMLMAMFILAWVRVVMTDMSVRCHRREIEQVENGGVERTIRDTNKANETGDTILPWKLSKEDDRSVDLTTTKDPDTPPLETLIIDMAWKDLFGTTTEEMVQERLLTTIKTNDNPALDIGFERTRNFVTEEAGERRKDKEETRPLSTVKMLVNLLRMMVLIGLLSGLSMTRDKLETGIRTRDTAMRFQERESLTLQVVVIVVLGS